MTETRYRAFDPYTCRLAGRNMVTAGAGTGKTYSIQILFLRMVLAGTPVTQILVVTFTNLATEELRNRLRKILQDACELCRRLLATGADARAEMLQDDAFAQVAPCFTDVSDDALTAAFRRLTDAMRDFDAAPISTIHGFCSRMLRENAFDSGVRYGLEMRSSMKALTKQLASQFWRRFCEAATERRQQAVALLGLMPDVLTADLQDVFANPDVIVKWNVELASVEAAQEQIREIEIHPLWSDLAGSLAACTAEDIGVVGGFSDAFLANFRRSFTRGTLEYWRVLGGDVLLDAVPAMENAYKEVSAAYAERCRASNISQTLSGKAQFLEDLEAELPVLANSKGTAQMEGLRKAMAGDNAAGCLARSVLDILKLRCLLEKYRTCVLFLAYHDIADNIDHAKARDGFMTYDDLLLILSSRLADGTVGERLRAVVRQQYTSVIVDEFQDTDAHQSAIFNALLSGDDDADAGRTYFMIGDEKQAIYMFRGGDVHTFYAEKEKCGGNVFSLTKNFRSSTAFIDTMNRFWLGHPDFFEPDSTICFEPIGDPARDAGTGRRHLELLHNGVPVRDGLLRFEHPRKDGSVEDVLCDWIRCFTETGYSLRKTVESVGEPEISERPVGYSDIAVLVRRKNSGVALQEVLWKRGIPAVLLKTQSVFKLGESGQLYLLLDAILHPGDSAKAMHVLLERLFAMPIERTDDIRAKCLPVFQMALKELLDVWQKGTFFAMFHQLLQKTMAELLGAGTVLDEEQERLTVAARIALSCSRDSLALLLQAVGYLHSVAMEQHLGPVGLGDFLYTRCVVRQQDNGFGSTEDASTSRIDEMEDDDELYPACLPTQDDAVKILTIHASKGLQFPIVLVDQFSPQKPGFHEDRIFHDAQRRRVINMTGKESVFGAECREEHYAEDRRLMYVAITRAQYCCWFCSHLPDYHLADDGYRQQLAEELAAKTAERDVFKAAHKRGTASGELKALTDAVNDVKKKLADFEALKDNALRHPELLLMPPGQPADAVADAVPPATPVPNAQAAPTELPLQKFTLKHDGLTPGWLTTSFSDLSKGRRDGAKPDGAADTDDDAEEQTAEDDFMQAMTFSEKIPYGERETIFQFVGGKRTGTCWHEIFEKLDFTLFGDVTGREDDASVQNAMIVDMLDAYGQLGKGDAREKRLAAFMAMLGRVVGQRVQIGDEAPWRLVDIAKERCLHECEFTYKFRHSKNGADFRKILETYVPPSVLRPDWEHGFSVAQKFTGSIDLLFQNPADGKYVIVDWKTNILDANPASFTVAGVTAEIREHVYVLQCILYAVAFVQYYCALSAAGKLMDSAARRAAVEDAYGHFGGCADMLVRGVREESGRVYGVFAYKPPLELILALDECCGVTLNMNGRGGRYDD